MKVPWPYRTKNSWTSTTTNSSRCSRASWIGGTWLTPWPIMGKSLTKSSIAQLSLETAQRQKFRLICERAGIKGNEKILNLGCGFGAFETYLFETYQDVTITSLTSSKVQAAYIQECLDDPKHPIRRGQCFLLQSVFGSDENEDLLDESYDAVFAIGLFEHINNLHSAFERISRVLVPGGYCFLHLIVSRPAFPQYQDSSRTLIGRYFPGGRIWPFQVMAKDNDFFTLEGSWYLNGMNYWKTLDEWHRRYWQNIDELYEAELDIDAIRHWNDYFSLCKTVLFAPLRGSVYGNGHFLFRKKLEAQHSQHPELLRHSDEHNHR